MTTGIDPTFASRLRKLQSSTPSLTLATRSLPRRGDFARFETLAQSLSGARALIPAIMTGVDPDAARRFLRERSFLRADVRKGPRRNGSTWLARNGFLLLRGNPTVEMFEWLADSLGGFVHDGQVHVGLPEPTRLLSENVWDWQRRALGDNERLHELKDLGRGVSIAILDTGVAAQHAAFAGEPLLEMDFTGEGGGDGDGHGTHCCGIAAGLRFKAADGTTFRGIAPAARRLSGKCLDRNGSGTWASVIQAVGWAAEQRADVISMSLGARSDGSGRSPVAMVVDRACESGCVMVVAAGNSGPKGRTIGTPGDARLAITVGAYNEHDVIAHFSSRGPTKVPGEGGQKPNVVAPGEHILSAGLPTNDNDRPLVCLSGTSMATPVIAGLCAALIGLEPRLRRNPEGVKQALVAMCRNIGDDPLAYGAGAPCLARSPIAQNYLANHNGVFPMLGTLARAAAVLAFGAGCAVAGAHLGRDIDSGHDVVSTARELGQQARDEACDGLCESPNSPRGTPPTHQHRNEQPVPDTRPMHRDLTTAQPSTRERATIATDPHLSPTERNRRMREALLGGP